MASARKARDYSAEYANRKQAAARIGQTPAGLRRRGGSVYGPLPQERSVLAEYGVTPREFEAMRIANLEYGPQTRLYDKKAKHRETQHWLTMAQRINEYDQDLDVPGDWSDARVGYVVSFYKAIVDPRTNYSSLPDVEGNREYKSGAKKGKRRTNRWQKLYLTRFASTIRDKRNGKIREHGVMDMHDFEVRYGHIAA